MIAILRARLKQKHRTVAFPDAPPVLPDRFRGLPCVRAAHCPAGCSRCIGSCPVGALSLVASRPRIDLGRCLFCAACARACPLAAITFTRDYRLATRSRAALTTDGHNYAVACALDSQMRALFGRSLKLRQVSAGGCNACEADTTVLSTIVFDLGRFGIQFVASPRHADGLLITGPVTQNMVLALKKTYDAVPAPKLVVAVGACAISGGSYAGHEEANDGAASTVPVDLYIPGCPPHPVTILDGLLRLLGRMQRLLPSKDRRSIMP
jgi:Ni,Fe-hydrogenase III small subunit/ferredoxin